jgi:hypothetical protein
MKFNELYSRLKKYDVILEHPDTAYFRIVNNKGLVEIDDTFSYASEACTYVIMGDVMFYANSDAMYHGELITTIKKFFFDKGDDLSPQNIYSIGTMSDDDVIEYQHKLMPLKHISRGGMRGNMLSLCPEVIQGRMWHSGKYTLVSVWNKMDRMTPKDIKLLKDLTARRNKDPDKVYMDMGEDNPSININDLLKPKQDATMPYFDPTIVHLADPKNKRELLLKQGARPKIPLDIRDKQQRQGD